jgi:VWFA-related protein
MRAIVPLLIAAAASAVVVVTPLGAQTPDTPRPTFRSSTDLVSIQTSVRDRRGRPVGGLAPADFEVRDNGVVKPILSIRADRRSPVSVAVLVDMSGSMRVGQKMAMTRDVFAALVGQLRDGQDELGIFTFDSALHERQPFTTAVSSLSGALDDFRPFGATSLYDATAATARHLARRSAAHKAIIILTDGVDTSSRLTAPEVSGLASSIDVPVYIVATLPAIDRVALAEGTATKTDGADLRELAEWTGGRLLFAGSFLKSTATASNLVDELRQQYILAIEAAGVNEWRRLEVTVKDRGKVVSARSGYFGG